MAAGSSRRGALIGLGAVVLIIGLVGAILLWNAASQRQQSAIDGLARAPVGCMTTLDFVEPGEYLVFVETVGTIDGVRGDCDVEGDFDVSGSRVPDVDLELIDPDGEEVDLDRASSDVTYNSGGFTGEAVFSVDIEEASDHLISVESDDEDDAFAVAIGRDPADGVGPMRIGAIVAGVLGLLLGALLILLGARKTQATVPAQNWPPGTPGYAPGSPAPQGPPVYGQPGVPPQQYPAQQPVAPQQYPPQQQPAPQQFPAQQPVAPQQYPPQQQPAPQQYPQQQAPQQYPPQQPASPQHQQIPPQPPPSQPAPPQPAPFSPGPPQAPADPAGSDQPIDWSPHADHTVRGLDTASPDADFIERLQADRDQRPDQPPPPVAPG